jgi:hypothetical protein
MKVLKSISMLLVALLITLGANAQAAGSTAPAAAPAKAATPAGKPKPVTTPAPKAGAVAADKKTGDARTKTGDKINKDLHGPKNETVYTGPKGGNYYLGGADGKTKVYLKK